MTAVLDLDIQEARDVETERGILHSMGFKSPRSDHLIMMQGIGSELDIDIEVSLIFGGLPKFLNASRLLDF